MERKEGEVKYNKCKNHKVEKEELDLLGSLYPDFTMAKKTLIDPTIEFMNANLNIYPADSNVLCLTHDDYSSHRWGVILVKAPDMTHWILSGEFGHYNESGEINEWTELDNKYFNFIENGEFSQSIEVKNYPFDFDGLKTALGDYR